MRGKVNWLHILQIFLVGLIGSIIFLLMVLPQNIGNIKNYPKVLRREEKSKSKVIETYNISDKDVKSFYEEFKNDFDKWEQKYGNMYSQEEGKKVINDYQNALSQSKKAKEDSKKSKKALGTSLLMPLAVTIVFCGIKTYEDAKG